MIGLHMLIVFAFLALPDNHAFTTGLLPCLSPCTNGPTIVMSKPDSSSRCSFSIPKFGCFKMTFTNHMFWRQTYSTSVHKCENARNWTARQAGLTDEKSFRRYWPGPMLPPLAASCRWNFEALAPSICFCCFWIRNEIPLWPLLSLTSLNYSLFQLHQAAATPRACPLESAPHNRRICFPATWQWDPQAALSLNEYHEDSENTKGRAAPTCIAGQSLTLYLSFFP